MFGTLNFHLAAFESYMANFSLHWGLLLITEMSVIKALLIFKWYWIVGVDEQFAGTFLILWNLGYTFLSQTAR